MRVCSVDGCGRRHEARGLCHRHYQQVLRRERRAKDPDRNNGGGVRPDLGERVAALRLAVEMASARLRQAAIVAQAPDVGAAKGVTVAGLIDDALDALDRGRY